MTLSLSYFHSSRFALSTLDPFMRSFYAEKDPNSSQEERVAVTMVILLSFSAGLAVILTAYHSICKTLNAVSYVGRNRISPRQASPHFQSDSSDLTLSMARSYGPQYTIRGDEWGQDGKTENDEEDDKYVVNDEGGHGNEGNSDDGINNEDYAVDDNDDYNEDDGDDNDGDDNDDNDARDEDQN
ncbi:hypothetical protein ElyMa_002299400 [Elysia marginata]|uniref:Uncharacterized protein n=1 Tax=Elysia marginata TaxID=1093978 RepID=A0AAV4G3S0_9GAST|nr:hypothetical protein ElyMa_002299400 [Elysia marginata]